MKSKFRVAAPAESRDTILGVRLTVAERAMLEKVAAGEGTTASAWARDAIAAAVRAWAEERGKGKK